MGGKDKLSVNVAVKGKGNKDYNYEVGKALACQGLNGDKQKRTISINGAKNLVVANSFDEYKEDGKDKKFAPDSREWVVQKDAKKMHIISTCGVFPVDNDKKNTQTQIFEKV